MTSSYAKIADLPAWGLYLDDKVVASIRAHDANQARDLFRRQGLKGERVKRLP